MAEETTETTGKAAPRGRPRQPFCRDCIRAGRPEVPKMPGQGYCKDCMRRRQRDSRRASQEDTNLIDAREKNFRDELDALRFEREAAFDRCVELERQLAQRQVDVRQMLPEELDSIQVRELKRELIGVKALGRTLLHRLREHEPDFGKDDDRYDF